MRIVISSGHGAKVRGAKGYLDEVDEARRVVEEVAVLLRNLGVEVKTFHDDTSTTQSQNLKTIVDYHNAQAREYDVSVHFNAYQTTSKPMGCEVLYVSQGELAAAVSMAMSEAGGLVNRGAKKRTDLYFLNNTKKPAILLEVCFVDSSTDANLYRANFSAICDAIAGVATPVNAAVPIDPEDQTQSPAPIPWNQTDIVCTKFGGKADPNTSAYDPKKTLNDTDMYVALPYKFKGSRPRVKVYNREVNVSAVGEIWDVGPWNTNDPYWETNTRPQAETGTDMRGRKTNKAGLDVSPAMDRALGLNGKGKVDWEFI